MKKRVIFLLTGLFIWTSVLLAQNVPEGVIGAFKEGNSQELNKYLGQADGRGHNGCFLFQPQGRQF